MRLFLICITSLHALGAFGQAGPPKEQNPNFTIPQSPSVGTQVIEWRRAEPLNGTIRLRLLDSVTKAEQTDSITPHTLHAGETEGKVTFTFARAGTFLIQCNVGTWEGADCGSSEIVITAEVSTSTTPSTTTTEQPPPDPTPTTASQDTTNSPEDSTRSSSSSSRTHNSDNAATTSGTSTSNRPPTNSELHTSRAASSSTNPSATTSAEAGGTPDVLETPIVGSNPLETTTSSTGSSARRTSMPGAIAGGVAGGLAVIGLIAFLLIRRRKRQRRRSENIFNREMMVRPRTSSSDNYVTFGAATEEKRLTRSEE